MTEGWGVKRRPKWQAPTARCSIARVLRGATKVSTRPLTVIPISLASTCTHAAMWGSFERKSRCCFVAQPVSTSAVHELTLTMLVL